MVKMKCLSTFSGDGGFDIALESTGEIETIAFIEKDDHCQMVLRHHWPNVPIFSDIKEVTVAKIKKQFGKIDIIVGGFPCQDVSLAGKRKGLAGERSGLWFEFLRLIKGIKPEWIIIENVPGLLSSNEGRDFEVILRGLVECGYGCAWRILDAKYFGVPQRRRRVFIVGHLGTGRAAEVLFEREGVLGNIAARSEPGQELAGTLKGGSGERGYPDPSDGNGEGLIAPTPFTENDQPISVRLAQTSSNGWGIAEDGIAHTLDSTGGDAVVKPTIFNQRGGYGISEEDDISPSLQSEGGTHQGGPSRMPLVVTNDSRAQSNDDGDALPLTQSDTGSGRQAVIFDLRGNSQHEQLDDQAATVRANEAKTAHQVVVQPDDRTVVGVDWAGDEKDKSVSVLHENKEGNLAEADTARALRAGASHSYQAVAVYKEHGGESVSDAQEVAGPLTAEGGAHQAGRSLVVEGKDNVPLVEAVDARNMVVDGGATPTLQAKDKGYSLNYQPLVIQHSTIGRQDEAGAQGSGVREDGTAYTLDSRGDPDVVAFQTEGSGQEATEDGTTPTLLSGGDPDKPEHHGARRTMAVAFQVADREHSFDANLTETAHTLQAHPQSESSNIQNGIVSRSTIRRFTPTETERLQGFPDGWTAIIGAKSHRLEQDELEYYRRQLETNYGREITDEEVHRIVSDSHRYRQMGNAVAVPVVAWIARRLVKVHHSPVKELKAEDLLPAFLTGGQMSLWE